jgi:hypothetical protein
MEATMLTAPPLIGRSHPGINFSRLEIGGDLGGLVMAVGSVVGLLIGLPAARLFFGAALLGAVLVAVVLRLATSDLRLPTRDFRLR